MEHLSSNWPAYAFALLVVPFVLFYISRRGKGVFIGGTIRETIGHAKGSDALGFETLVTVHLLESSDPTRAVAVEIVSKVLADIRSTPLTLSSQEAAALGALLNEASSKRSN